MLDRLKSIEERYEKLNEYLSDPEVVNDLRSFVNIRKNNPIFKKLLRYIDNIVRLTTS